LYNYLFARRHNGDFILRIEDTDQGRYVEGAEQYILDCLEWCGLTPDEGPHNPGAYGPYRQSERKEKGLYKKYAEQLIQEGHAYYAFDTPEELEEMRTKYKAPDNPSPQYNHTLRKKMHNSLHLDPAETQRLLDAGTPYVIRIRVDPDQEVRFTDMIRGEVVFQTDGVDDRLMEITHAFRGEEWLPSAPVHILLWKYLFGIENMPEWAHLPLILKPEGNGKLSKRDGDRLGFPVFAMNWTDPRTNEPATGFKETGFLPEAFINLLAVLGWNDGTPQELFTLDELIEKFSMDRVHKGGAKFDFEKAKWFNHEWIKKLPVDAYSEQVRALFKEKDISVGSHASTGASSGNPASSAASAGVAGSPDFEKVLSLVKDRCTLLPDFVQQASFFFAAPGNDIDLSPIKPKWNDAKNLFFVELIRQFQLQQHWDHDSLEAEFKEMAAAAAIKPSDLLQPLRIMLVGGKFGPGVFDIAALLGKEETLRRIRHTLGLLQA
jgi:glutamyl-tRNA synthetase